MKSSLRQTQPKVVVCLYDLALWYLQRTNRYPRNWRITLGDQIDRLMLKMVAAGQRAALRSAKLTILEELSDDLEVLRILTRLSADLKCLDAKQFEFVVRQMAEIGRQIGGWLKQQGKR